MEWNYIEDKDFQNLSAFINETTMDESNFEKISYNMLSVLSWILVVCGMLENAVICWILAHKKMCLKSFSNFHLLNLAITDILFRIISTPELLSGELIGRSDATCKIGEFGKYTTLAVTFALLAGIAFDRYIHIVHPLRARTVTWKHSRNLILMSWIYGALCSAPFLYSTEWEVFVDEEISEKFWNCRDIPGLPFQISLFVFVGCSFIIPLVFMGVVYSRIVIVLWRRARNKMINKNMANIKIRAVKMMVLIVFTYFITWGPKLLLKIVEDLYFIEVTSEEGDDEGSTEDDELGKGKETFTFLLLEVAFETLSLASSILNPLIFGYYNRSFREELKSIYFGVKSALAQPFKKRRENQ